LYEKVRFYFLLDVLPRTDVLPVYFAAYVLYWHPSLPLQKAQHERFGLLALADLSRLGLEYVFKTCLTIV
jgi:hypothetical protein